MSTLASPLPPRRLPLSLLIGLGFIAQVLSIFTLWGHQSDAGEFLGRYSIRYAIVLAANVLLLLTWAAVFVRRGQVAAWAGKLSPVRRIRIILLSGIAVFVLCLFPVEAVIKEYASLNWLLVAACLAYTLPDRETLRRWTWIPWLILALFFIPTLITILTNLPFSPDEAHWADYASSPFEATGLYARTWLQEPATISPGLGWSVAAYGWALENVAFDIKVGRLWNFYFYLLAIAGIGLVTWRLYGRRAAAVSVIFALLSQAFIPFLDYRPDHQLPAAAMLITFAALQARYAAGGRGVWHFLCGLAATLALELHAAAVTLAIGFSLFYLAEFVILSYRQRRLAPLGPLLGFGIGALIGSAIYFALNIQPVGGLQAYLQYLVQTRWTPGLILRFLTWPSLFEGMVILAGIAYLIWRRAHADRLILGIIVCVVIGITALDPVGYRTIFAALYIIPVGTLVTTALPDFSFDTSRSLRYMLVALGLLAMMTVLWIGEFVNWPTVEQVAQTGELPPFLYEDLKPKLLPLLQDNDVVASSHLLIWTIPRHPQLVSVGSEPTAMRRWNLTDPLQVWELVKPTVIVNIENQMTIEKGLQTYLQNHRFVICTQFKVLQTQITVLRETCPPASSS